MRIAFVHPDYPGADGTGATHTASVLVRTLADRGHDLTVFCRTSPESESGSEDVEKSRSANGETGRSTDNQTAGAIEIRDLAVSGSSHHTATDLNRKLRRQLQSGAFDDFDVVHSYLPTSLPAMGQIGNAASAKTVVSLNAYGGICPKNDLQYMDKQRCHRRGLLRCTACSVATSPGNDEFGAAYQSLSRLGNLRQIRAGLAHLDGVDRFQALSSHVKTVYEEFGFPADRIAVVPNPLDEQFCIPHTSAFKPPYDLLYVGALEGHKGVDRLIPMLRHVRDSGIDSRLTVVGSGGRSSAMQRLAHDQGVADHLTLQGRRPYTELPSVYADHDLFVYPGKWEEPFGRVFLEALATGTPVVATGVGGVADIVGDAGVVTGNSAEELAAGVRTAIRERGLATLSERCESRLTSYRPDRVVPELESMYSDAGEGQYVDDPI